MAYSALIYLGLLGLMEFFGQYQEKLRLNPHRNVLFLYMLIPNLLFAFIFGCRYGVGTDYPDYLNDYLAGRVRMVEPFFMYLEGFFRNNGFHYAWFFGACAFIQISFYTAAFKDRKVYPWLILVLVLGGRWLSWCNGIRQCIAGCIFVYSIHFIEEKKPLYYYICIIIAMMFHRSAMILLPFYFIDKIDFFKRKWMPWAIFFLSFVASFGVLNGFMERNWGVVSNFLGYDVYSDQAITARINYQEGQSSGLGRILSIFISIIIIILAQNEKYENDSKWFVILSNLFLIGLFGNIAFNSNVVLSRPFGFFEEFRGVMVAYLLFYFIKSKTNNLYRFLSIILLITQILWFIAIIYRGNVNTAEFHFFWEFV